MAAIKIEGYQRVAVKGADGKTTYTRDKGDNVAVALRGKSLEEVGGIMSENGLGEDFAALNAPREVEGGEPKTLNNGQVRMLCGQKLRALLKKNGTILVDGETVENDLPVKAAKTEAVAESTEEEAA